VNRRTLPSWLIFTACAIGALWAKGAFGKWHEFNPPGSVNGQGIHKEMMSRCPEYMLRQIRNTDRPTQCHEATHAVNGEISRIYGHNYCAFYVGNGRCYIIADPPNVTVGMVARNVPQEHRTGRFNTYLSGDRVGRNCLTLIDEYVCYANDAQCTQELGLPTDGGLKFAQEFTVFADVLVRTVKERQPDYAGMATLTQFVEWQRQRVAEMAQPQARGTILYGDLAELPRVFHQRNRTGSCVHHSTSHILHYMGLHKEAKWWISTYRGGDSPSPHHSKLKRSGLKYAMTTDGDTDFLEWCIKNRYMMGVTTKPMHCLNFMGRVEKNGRQYAVLLDNNRPGYLEHDPWDSWFQKYKRSGWAFTILSGDIPPPVPTGVVPLWPEQSRQLFCSR
jgi:hypothetical protein